MDVPIYDTRTKNRSFLLIAKHLKDTGVKNWAFPLQLYDPDLKRIDPHNPNLTKHIKMKILAEIKRNPWYYVREVARIPVPGGSVPFKLDRGNLAMLFCCFNSINFTLILPRQSGKTQGILTALVYLYNFVMSNTEIAIGNKKFDDSKLNVKRFKAQQELLPQWMLKLNPAKDQDNIENYMQIETKNNIKALPSAKSKEMADGLGRGFTTPIVWWDEFAFLAYNDVIYKSASPAQSRAAEEAKKQGKPTFKGITTTPSDLDTEYGQYCKSFIDSAAPFHENIYDMSQQDIDEYMAFNSKNDFVHIEFSYKELGRDQKWYKQQLRALDNDLKTFKREILLQWSKTSDSSVFEEENIEEIDKYKRTKYNPLPLLNKHYTLKVFQPFIPSKQYVIGVDVAGGLDNDSSAVVVTDPVTMQPVAYFAHNKIDTDEFFDLLKYILQAYFPKGILCIERNSYGLTIIQRLVKTEFKSQIFARNIVNTDREKLTDVKKQKLSTSDSETIEYGINTTGFSRNYMIELLKSEVLNNPEVFMVDRIIQEIRTLEYKSNGKIEHGSGHHDDVLFAYLFTRYAMSLSEDFSKYRKVDAADSRASMAVINRLNDSRFDKTLEIEKQFDNYERAQMMQDNTISRETSALSSIMSLNSL